MTHEHSRRRREIAHEYREKGRLNDAGDYFTLAAYEYLGECPLTSGRTISHAEYYLLQSAVCYRIDENWNRCENRCHQGILIAEDVLESVKRADKPENFYDRARRGALYEYIGDFRTVGELGEAREAYDNASQIYQNAGDPNTGYSEQEHMWLMEFFDLVASAVNDGLDDKWRSLLSDTTFSEWVEYKRERLPTLLDALDERGEWVWEDAD